MAAGRLIAPRKVPHAGARMKGAGLCAGIGHRVARVAPFAADDGATRFIERLRASHRAMLENLAELDEIAPVRRRRVGGKTLTLREYLIDAGARDFTALYWVPPDPGEPILLLNLRIGGQSRFRWSDKG